MQRIAALTLALNACAFASATHAQPASTSAVPAYPAKTVRVVCPWPPGGLIDVVGRIVFIGPAPK